jgi:rhodanese-related sulfurtransferase
MKTVYWKALFPLLLLLAVLLLVACVQTTARTGSTVLETTSSSSEVPSINTLNGYNLIQKNRDNPNFIILDVRTTDEFKSGYIAGAINIDYNSPDFKANIGKLDKNKQYLVYCRTGIRGAAAVQIMIDLGFKQVQNLTGAITSWIEDGYPIVK